MTERQNLLESIASTAADYRAGDLTVISPEHVNRWIKQFDVAVQIPILREMDYTLKSTYFSLSRVIAFLRELLQTKNLAGTDPCTFWRGVQFLDIQGDGNSQTDMLALFDEVLQEKCSFGIEQSDRASTVYVYLDDAIFTGNRVRRDLEKWIAEQAPVRARAHVISIVTSQRCSILRKRTHQQSSHCCRQENRRQVVACNHPGESKKSLPSRRRIMAHNHPG